MYCTVPAAPPPPPPCNNRCLLDVNMKGTSEHEVLFPLVHYGLKCTKTTQRQILYNIALVHSLPMSSITHSLLLVVMGLLTLLGIDSLPSSKTVLLYPHFQHCSTVVEAAACSAVIAIVCVWESAAFHCPCTSQLLVGLKASQFVGFCQEQGSH